MRTLYALAQRAFRKRQAEGAKRTQELSPVCPEEPAKISAKLENSNRTPDLVTNSELAGPVRGLHSRIIALKGLCGIRFMFKSQFGSSF
jgi:hypothetical protein